MSHMPSETHKIVWRDADTGTKSPTIISQYLNMENWHHLMVIAVRTVGTGNAALNLFAATDAAGTGSTAVGTTMGTTSNTGLLNAASFSGSIGNPGAGMMVAECNYSDVAVAGGDLQYVAAKIQAATATDEWGVCYIFTNPRYGQADQTVTGNSV